MHDLREIRENPEKFKTGLIRRGEDRTVIDKVLNLDEERRKLILEVETLKSKRNSESQQVGLLKKKGEDASEIIVAMKRLGDEIKELDEKQGLIETQIEELLLGIPNVPHPSIPDGKDDKENVTVNLWGEPTKFTFDPKPHWDIGTDLDILDFDRAGKITGSRFTIMKKSAAKLSRALISFMIDVHTSQNGYSEIYPPYMVNSASMTGTGQLPKFAEDAFKIDKTDYWLVPTAEVPVTNMYRDEILDISDLPIYHVAYTACFRAEAGSAGRDTRGLIRQHQFDKVELVKFVLPEDSYNELDKLTANAARILELLGLPYRKVMMCTGDVGFSAAKKFDLEVWMPSYNNYVEISSCSNFEAFQARRANIRFRREAGAKPEFVHTLNGSGLAVGRTIAAIMENYQTEDGSVIVPEALRPYMGIDKISK
ncbi:MAG: serine--tRNA ligase [Firmicutes bacterium]|nr:serine--tRNA ligase [Bacillota bacterium]